MVANSEKRDSRSVYCVILAGGSGERLWPLSRSCRPKQVLEVGGQKTLLDQALDRLAMLVPVDNTWICTTQQHAPLIRALAGDKVGTLLIEPASRNTGPAILLACLEIYKKDPNAIVLFVPADPFIPPHDYGLFAGYLDHAIDFAREQERIVLLGVKPTFAATGYGYIEFKNHHIAPYPVLKFHEKPSKEVAEQYFTSGTMLWNIGMFCGHVRIFLEQFKELAPDMYNGVMQYQLGQASYQDVVADSVDYALMEKSTKISVLPVDFSWCDVGNLEIFLSIKKAYGSQEPTVFEVESSNNLIDADGCVVGLIGVHDMCIIQADGVLLIAKRDDTEKVRALVKQLKHNKLNKYL